MHIVISTIFFFYHITILFVVQSVFVNLVYIITDKQKTLHFSVYHY